MATPQRQLEVYAPPDKHRRRDLPLVRVTPAARKWTGVLPDKFIATLVSRVSQVNLQNSVAALCAFPTRHTKSAYIGQVADWLVGRFQSFGYASVIKHPYNAEGLLLHNVVCTKPGSGNTGQVIVLCAQYESRMQNIADSSAPAPGADDNATGVAALLEIARILASCELRDTVQFAAFSGEEQGYWGSTAYADYVQTNNINLHRLINLDEVGYPPPDFSIIVERDEGNAVSSNDPASQAFGSVMAQMAADYTSMPVQLGPIYGSDYMPFEARGYVVIGAYEAGDNPNYHQSTDTAPTVNFAYVAEATRMTLATVLKEAAAVVDETASGVDVYIRDNPADTGEQPSGPLHWESPDIWVRNNAPPADPNDPADPSYGEDPDAGHQPPINDVPNYLYVQVHNRGSQPAAGLSVKAYHCNPATAMIWPDDFNLMGELPATDPVLAGGVARVGPFVWTPHIVDHECLFAIVSGPGDHAVPDIYSGQLEHDLLVRYDNNVGQRNVKPVNSTPGGKVEAAFLVRGATHPSINTLRIDAAELPPDTAITLRVAHNLTDPPASITGFQLTHQSSHWSTLSLPGGAVGGIAGFAMESRETRSATLDIDFSYQAEHLRRYRIVASQEQDGVPAGQLTIEITAIKESEDYYYGNVRTRELHLFGCAYRRKMHPGNQAPFQTIAEAVARGYNGCAFCLPAVNTG